MRSATRGLVRGAVIAMAGVALSCASGAPAAAQDRAAFYAGKRVQIIIGFDAGGGYDVYARLLARHLGKHIPGNPSFISQNMPGAGSRTAANYLYNIAAKDGTVIGTIGQGTPLDQALKVPGVQFDVAKFNWLGNPIVDNLLTVTAKVSGVTTLAELKAKGGVACGDVGAGPTSTFPAILNRLMGIQNKIIPGYPGVNAVYLAMERGEVECIGGTTWSSLKSTRGQKLRDRDLNLLVQWGTAKDPSISAYAQTDVPLILDIATNEIDRRALVYIGTSATLGRPFAAPPGVPGDRVELLRSAFTKTMEDAEFRAEAAKGNLDINAISGAEVQKLASAVVAAPEVELARAKELIAVGK